MNAGNSSPDRSENLVRDRVDPGGHLVGRDFRVALATEENNLVSLLNTSYIGYIDHSQIHAHSSDYWSALTAHQNLTAIGKQALITVGVTNRQRRDHALPPGDERLAVAYAAFGRH